MKKFVQQAYYTYDVDTVLAHVQTTKKGLTDFDAQGRKQSFGSNELPIKEKNGPFMLLVRQLQSPLIYIILIAAGISFVIGHHADAIFIGIVVLINTVVGFLQEFKAQHALAALRSSVVPTARVIRAGIKREVPTEDLVVGDIVVLTAGDRTPADGRLLVVEDLLVDEATLTGESTAVAKVSNVLSTVTGLGDQTNMVFMSSHVVSGDATYVVTATGRDTEIGKIAELVRDGSEAEDPLKKKFAQLSRMIGFVVLALIAVFAVLGLLRGHTLVEVLVTSTALVVSAIPEGLLPAVTIVMIFGVRRLARKQALVRRLGATETIGAITIICTDKTGTLTEGKMRVRHILTGAQELLSHDAGFTKKNQKEGHLLAPAEHLQALVIAGIVNDAFVENKQDELTDWIIHGRPTDRALLEAALQAGIDPDAFHTTHERVSHIAFSSARKYAAHIYRTEHGDDRMLTIGAPEKILARSQRIDVDAVRTVDLDSREGDALKKRLSDLTAQGLRVLACAEKTIQKDVRKDDYQEVDVDNLTLVGFIALKDPVRKDAEIALARAQRAGIRLMIITGDHAQTAEAIVAQLGWYVSPEHVCTGMELDAMDDETLRERVGTISIFARVAPEHKIRIVQALQANDEVVAMVGDGVNDAPALKAAHVGISMGNGTDITKNVADIVLLNSSFTTIIDAIEQGRIIFENIRRILIYLLADDFSELFIFFVAIIFGLPMPLVAAQILWINLIEDSLPNIALTTERDTKGVMDEPPRTPGEPILASPHRRFMVAIFAISGAAATGMFVGVLLLSQNLALAQTMTFVLIAFDSLAMTYVLRSFRQSIFRRDIFSNKMINRAVFLSFVILLVGVYAEVFQGILQTVPLDTAAWIIVIVVTMVEIIFLEIAKRAFFDKVKHVTMDI